MPSQDTQKSFITNLWERRFFQFFATYVAASWGAIQFIEWGVTRYSIPSAWVDKLVVFLLVMLPLVLCVIYFHGKPGTDKWLKFEKVFYPINFVVALMMSMFLVNSTAESITEEVTVTDVDGLTIVREIPKLEYNKKIAIFPVESDSDVQPWESVGISELLNNKLEQDMRILVSSALSLADHYEQYGFKMLEPIPFSAKLNLAEDFYSDFFVDSKFLNNDKKSIDVKIYETLTGEEVAQEIIKGDDIFQLTENTSTFINSKIKLSEVEGKELYKDLPSSNLITTDSAALKLYFEASILLQNDLSRVDEAYAILESSVEKDPTCAECWIRLVQLKLMQSKDQDKERANALKYVENLPERQQLKIKLINYLAQNDLDSSFKLCEMWRKLYPQDSKPVTDLIGLYSMALRTEDAKAVAKDAIEKGHKGSIYLTYANLLIQTKDWDEAEKYLKIYKKEYPKQFEATSLLVDTYSGKGQMEKAAEALDELILMKPNEKSYQIKKSQLFSKQNQFEKAISILKKTLRLTENTSDSITNYSEQLKVYERALQFEEYGKIRRKMKSVILRNYPPIAYYQIGARTIGYYRDIGFTDSISYQYKELGEMLPPSQRTMMAEVIEFSLKFLSSDSEGLDEKYQKVKPMFAALGNDMTTLLYDSEIAYMKGNYEDAIKLFGESKKAATDVSMISKSYYDAHLKLNKYNEGLVVINDLLKDDPLNPVLNLYKAQFYQKLNKTKEAKETLELVLDVFRASDQRYKYTIRANDLAVELGI